MFDEKLPPGNASNPPAAKILLADDDASMRRFLEIVLARLNYDVTTAEDGLAAMQAALSGDFDLVVADAVMPHLTGYDLCRMLKQNPKYKNVPLVILSGLENNSENTDRCIADAYLLKGENLKGQLDETLSRLLAERIGA
ncbi:MAG TPA: response regulator [Pyrinomonadaceae bacterium]|nr:response regulator [Pyrinomonadaceae bacterium]